ncbi:armadillo-type protein [Obelidium mucronatum]|nr:armadillo-type protein [Obelidium mucronatum]
MFVRNLPRDWVIWYDAQVRKGLKAFVTQITGPLIRIIGDRVVPGVKAAILKTLGLLLVKVPANLKPFLPQLQRTFIKSLSEPVLFVQTPARKCLTLLISLQPRLDPLIAELTTGIKTAEDKSVRDAMWGSLLGLLSGLEGKDITDVSKKTVETILVDTLFTTGENDDIIRKFAAKCFAVYCKYLSAEEAKTLISSKLLSKSILDDLNAAYMKRHGLMETVSRILIKCPDVITSNAAIWSATVSKVIEGFESNKSVVLEATVSSANSILMLNASDSILEDEEVVVLLKALVDLAKEGLEAVSPHLQLLVPTLMQLVRERQTTQIQMFYKSTCSGLDNTAARNTNDYAKRVLSKLAEKESDDEGGDDDDEGSDDF